jgi:hypothetical protein
LESLFITQLDQCVTQTSLLYPETLSTSFALLPRVHPITQSFDGLTQVTILVDFSQKALSLSSRRIAARTEAL